MFHKILVALDGSPHSEAALHYAVGLAQQHNAELGILHAYTHVGDMFGTPNYEQILTTRIAVGETLLKAVCRTLPVGLVATTHLLEGPAAMAIMRVAQAEGYDLIVVGSRGLGHVGGLLLGSVSSTVAQRAPCPVLIVHGLPQTSGNEVTTVTAALASS